MTVAWQGSLASKLLNRPAQAIKGAALFTLNTPSKERRRDSRCSSSMQADIAQICCLKELLGRFAQSSGLKVNFNKSSIIPINVPDDKMTALAAAFVVKLDHYLSLTWDCQWATLNQGFRISHQLWIE
jgi:hypothetical protein